MSKRFKYRVLVVDDDEDLLESTTSILSRQGYEVHTARDGFEALAALRGSTPEVLVTDLKMPNMSGFELLAVVRKRFPAIGVIAWSGEFSPLTPPEGLLADRFVQKGTNSNFELVEGIRELLMQLPVRGQQAKPDSAPAWLPRSAKGYVVVTCPMCLRSFSVSAGHLQYGVVQRDSCLHCGADVKYRIDQTVSAEAGRHTIVEEAQKQLAQSRRTIEDSKTIVRNRRRT